MAPVKFYWTPFQPGALHSCQAACTPLSPGRSSVHVPEGRRDGGQKGGAGDRSSAPGVGPSLSPQNRPKGPQSSRPMNPSCRALGQPLVVSPRPATWLVCARWPSAWLPGSEGHQWGLLRAGELPCSSAAGTPALPPHHWSLTLPRRCEHPSPSGEQGGGRRRGAGLGAPGRHKLANPCPALPGLSFSFFLF